MLEWCFSGLVYLPSYKRTLLCCPWLQELLLSNSHMPSMVSCILHMKYMGYKHIFHSSHSCSIPMRCMLFGSLVCTSRVNKLLEVMQLIGGRLNIKVTESSSRFHTLNNCKLQQSDIIPSHILCVLSYFRLWHPRCSWLPAYCIFSPHLDVMASLPAFLFFPLAHRNNLSSILTWVSSEPLYQLIHSYLVLDP